MPKIVDWAPMRSAPHDGTAFLACGPEAMAVCYVSVDGTLCFEATQAIVEEDDFQPTHWLPLPMRPEEYDT